MWRKVAMPLVAFFFAFCSRHVSASPDVGGPLQCATTFLVTARCGTARGLRPTAAPMDPRISASSGSVRNCSIDEARWPPMCLLMNASGVNAV